MSLEDVGAENASLDVGQYSPFSEELAGLKYLKLTSNGDDGVQIVGESWEEIDGLLTQMKAAVEEEILRSPTRVIMEITLDLTPGVSHRSIEHLAAEIAAQSSGLKWVRQSSVEVK